MRKFLLNSLKFLLLDLPLGLAVVGIVGSVIILGVPSLWRQSHVMYGFRAPPPTEVEGYAMMVFLGCLVVATITGFIHSRLGRKQEIHDGRRTSEGWLTFHHPQDGSMWMWVPLKELRPDLTRSDTQIDGSPVHVALPCLSQAPAE